MKKYSKCILILFLSAFFLSCGGDIITVLDEYNSPYAIKAIAGNGSISIEFISGITASDFEGFNIYANTTGIFTLYDDAIRNDDGSLPTIPYDVHSRELITLDVPGDYVSGVTYYVTVTAFGLNELATDGRIETAISTIVEVVPN